MADDGMMLNFELPSDAFTAKPSFKGGSWKDRLTARKSAEWGRMKANERAQTQTAFGSNREQDEELVLPGGHPAKRARTDDGGEVRPASRPSGQRQIPADGARNPAQKPRNGDFVSSLFTYNPTSTVAKPEPEVEDETPIEPTNAPLNDELATFTNLGLSSNIAAHLLNKMEIKAPTAIQRKAVEQLCSKHQDAFIQAQTGSGKTLAYLLPIVQQISQISKQMKAAGQNFNRKSGLFAIILAPTRELSKQINTVLESLLSCCHWIVGGTVIGGENKNSEKARLRKGLNILVATPGRLADHLNNTEVLDVSNVRWLVLDEGDRLMELGFEQEIQKIVSVMNLRSRKTQEKEISGLPERRTTVLCSATIKADVEQLRSIALKDPVSISVDPSETPEGQADGVVKTGFSAPAQLKQSYAIVPPKQRLVTLVAVLRQAFKRKGSVMKCMLFMSCADSVDFHFEILAYGKTTDGDKTKDEAAEAEAQKTPSRPATSKTDKIPQGNTIVESRTQGFGHAFAPKDNPSQVFRLHGSLQQATRTSTLKAFAKCEEPALLVCTDVASRGLDLPNVDLVIEYDPPFSKDDHIHRIGRTARAGKDGRAMIFLQPGCEEGYVEILKESMPRNLTRHESEELLKKGFSATSGVVNSRDWEVRATDWQLDVERWALDNPKHLEQARRAFQSHMRAYQTHVAAEHSIFDKKALHLGHLAKAFALRDKPGNIGVPGMRPGKEAGNKTKEARRTQAAKKAGGAKRPRSNDDLDVPENTDEQEARKKMKAKMRALEFRSGASEFNLG